MKVVIIGKGLMLANLILGAIDAKVDIVGVLRYERTVNNSLYLALNDCISNNYETTLLKQYNIKSLNFKTINCEEFKSFLITENIDLLIVGTWKERIREDVFKIPSIGTVNMHPSLLPKYRGPNPYLQTILNGEKESGLTLHLVDKDYDTGAILKQIKVKILESDTSKELRERTVIFARTLIKEFLLDLSKGVFDVPTPQRKELASYYKNITGEEKMLDFEKQTSVEICRTIKALHPFLPTYITYKNVFFVVNPYKLKILEKVDCLPNTVINKNTDTKSLTIVCSDKKAIKFEGLSLYKFGWFTKFYIKYFVKVKSLFI